MGWSFKVKTHGFISSFRIIIIHEIEDNLTEAWIEHSDYGMKNNPYLLQFSEVVNADADLTADSIQINK